MSENDKPKVISLANRQAFQPPPEPVFTADGKQIDQNSIDTLRIALKEAEDGDLHNVCIVAWSETAKQPRCWTQFMPGIDVRQQALRQMALCDLLKNFLADIAVFGLEGVEIAEDGEIEEGDEE